MLLSPFAGTAEQASLVIVNYNKRNYNTHTHPHRHTLTQLETLPLDYSGCVVQWMPPMRRERKRLGTRDREIGHLDAEKGRKKNDGEEEEENNEQIGSLGHH